MKITAIVDPGYGKNWLFVKVETSDGLHGWGDAIRRPTAIIRSSPS